MARSSLVSMVNFHWPLVRGETEIKACCQALKKRESTLRASCGNECVKTYLDC